MAAINFRNETYLPLLGQDNAYVMVKHKDGTTDASSLSLCIDSFTRGSFGTTVGRIVEERVSSNHGHVAASPAMAHTGFTGWMVPRGILW